MYFNPRIFLGPRFQIHLNVALNAGNSSDWAFDGFTIIITKQHGYIESGGYGGSIGYWNIPNAVVAELDLWTNWEYYDVSDNSVSIHECTSSRCLPYENHQAAQANIKHMVRLFYLVQL